MAVIVSRFRKCALAASASLCLLMMPGETVFGTGPAEAQTFIEKFLKRDAQRARPQRKRTATKRSQKRPAAKRENRTAQKAEPKPQQPAAAVPVPIPTPRPETEPAEEAKPVPVPAPTPEAPPVPEEKPKEAEKAPPPPPKPEPEKPAEPEKAEPSEKAEPAEKTEPTEKSEPTEKTQKKDERIYQVSCPALMSGAVEGKLVPPIEDGPQCGTHSPLSLTAIGKDTPLKFANPITTNCAMAVTLADWSVDVDKAAKEIYGADTKIASIGTGSDYQCRKVNGASEGRVSEHAFANALDIMSFTFADGSKTELESGWNGSDKEKAFWRAVHDASCERFMTVIGPDGDAAHRTNMHLDQGCHGKSCLARICQ